MLPQSATRHLGFFVDLNEKTIAVTGKHRVKIVKFFDKFLLILREKGRLLVRALQKMLGLQIWISTVFRIARQFLSSICDLLRTAGAHPYLYPRQHKSLIARVIFDLKFWRRFVLSKPKAPFETLLGQLPVNTNELSSDAATSWGMAGVLVFSNESPRKDRIQGLFWQIPWVEWYKVIPMPSLTVGSVKINVAEFLALLITCETFTSFCKGKYTTIVTDNISAKSWVNKARCPHFPFDRCAQGLHLHMLKHSIKLRASWIPSGDNTLADLCSRKKFSMNAAGHSIGGRQIRKVKPRWTNVTKYL